jgi:hypothetical protein
MKVVNEFFELNQFDKTIFNNGITIEALRQFEQQTKIGINILYIDPRGPEFTRFDYVSYIGICGVFKQITAPS